MDIFFVNKIPLLITLIHNNDSTTTSHFPTQTDRDIFKYFWNIHVFCLKHGLEMTTVHDDGEFATVQELISEMLSGPMVNLMSANKHVPKIEQIVWVLK